MNIFLVRHCKAEGQSPTAQLTEEGHRQARTLAAFFGEKNIQGIYSSPFVRAIHSVAPLASKLGMHVMTDDRLSERVLCGEDRPEWREMLRSTFVDLDLCYEGGESSAAAMERALSVIKEIRESGLTDVVVVTHGNLMSLLLKYYDNKFGYEAWESLSNPDVYHLDFHEKTPGIRRIWA